MNLPLIALKSQSVDASPSLMLRSPSSFVTVTGERWQEGSTSVRSLSQGSRRRRFPSASTVCGIAMHSLASHLCHLHSVHKCRRSASPHVYLQAASGLEDNSERERGRFDDGASHESWCVVYSTRPVQLAKCYSTGLSNIMTSSILGGGQLLRNRTASGIN
jgi:hypothetical protein